MIIGFQRALFSNEAGLGSSAIAHAAVKTAEPLTEGFVALLEPLLDTIVICTLTALVIVVTSLHVPNLLNTQMSGVSLTSAAFKHHFAYFDKPLAFVVFLFAFSTMISWSYYGLKAWRTLVGPSDIWRYLFQIIFCLCLAVGCMVRLKSVLDISDACLFLLSIPNVIGLYCLGPQIAKRLKKFLRAANN